MLCQLAVVDVRGLLMFGAQVFIPETRSFNEFTVVEVPCDCEGKLCRIGGIVKTYFYIKKLGYII